MEEQAAPVCPPMQAPRAGVHLLPGIAAKVGSRVADDD